jgi:hypothetical protein
MSFLLPALALSGLLSGAAQAAEDDYDFELEGYYRLRGYRFRDLVDEQDGVGNFMAMRLRLQPQFNFQDRAKFFMMMDMLDDVVAGDNMSLLPAAVFAQDPSYTRIEGQNQDFFQRSTAAPMVKRAWVEFKLPVGTMRVGRQESNWGMGILSNHGNGFDDTFGENHYGSTFDRVLFATNPVSIAQTIAGKRVTNFPLFLGVGVDRLVEDPLETYYGYQCATQDSGGAAVGQTLPDGTINPDYDRRCDTFNNLEQKPGRDGYHDLDHDYTEPRSPSNRTDDWFIDSNDDAWEMVYLAIFRGEDRPMFGSTGDFTLGAYAIDRQQVETDSRVQIYDVYTKFLWKGIYLEGEALHIRGKSSGLALPGTYDPSSKLDNPLEKQVNIWGWVARGGYIKPAYQGIFEAGFSSGDANVADGELTGRSLHPDYNVGLLLYEEVLSRVTSRTWTSGATPLWSQGGVWNSTYIFPNATIRPTEGLELTGAYLLAWPHEPDGARIRCGAGDDVACEQPYDGELAKEIGWEADFSAKYKFAKHMLFSAEVGYAQVSNRIPLENLGLNPNGKFFTSQYRIAYEF